MLAKPIALPHLLLAVVLALAAGCGEPPAGEQQPTAGESGSETGEGSPEATGPRRYTVRGVVRQLPAATDPSSQLMILHEPIPDFVNSEGYETGMAPMTMPFPLADGVSLDGIEVGGWVELTFEVDWQASPAMRVLAIAPAAPPPPSGGAGPGAR